MPRNSSSVESFIQCTEFYLVCRIFPSAENFIYFVEIYPMWRILSGVENFIEYIDFFPLFSLTKQQKMATIIKDFRKYNCN